MPISLQSSSRFGRHVWLLQTSGGPLSEGCIFPYIGEFDFSLQLVPICCRGQLHQFLVLRLPLEPFSQVSVFLFPTCGTELSAK